MGDDESADDEKQLNAEVSVFQHVRALRKVHVGKAVGGGATIAVVEHDDGQNRKNPQQVDQFDMAGRLAGSRKRLWPRRSVNHSGARIKSPVRRSTLQSVSHTGCFSMRRRDAREVTDCIGLARNATTVSRMTAGRSAARPFL